jgi:mersacidin/lichenicidin family type 2 lantibiotic
MRLSWRAALPAKSSALSPVPAGHPADVLGHAISERIVWEYTPPAGRSQQTVRGAHLLTSMGAGQTFIDQLGPAAASPPKNDHLRTARTACLLGLLDRATRTGRADEPWYEPLFTAKDLDEALASVPDIWAADVAAVTALALPQLAHLAGPIIPAPIFTGSGLVGGAAADLIIGSTLVEIKAIGSPELNLRDLHQVVCYALLDSHDQYELTSIAILSARGRSGERDHTSFPHRSEGEQNRQKLAFQSRPARADTLRIEGSPAVNTTVRAWKDPEFRRSLDETPDMPTGLVELADDELDAVPGGTGWGCVIGTIGLTLTVCSPSGTLCGSCSFGTRACC